MYPDTPPGPPLHPPVSQTAPYDAPGGSIAVKNKFELEKYTKVHNRPRTPYTKSPAHPLKSKGKKAFWKCRISILHDGMVSLMLISNGQHIFYCIPPLYVLAESAQILPCISPFSLTSAANKNQEIHEKCPKLQFNGIFNNFS